ncbi:helix-hairpin-helix domain-containing protein [Dactylosporangium sp. NPDC049742]|uniref:ComEA family DNA-binding protein n=1 Tax=Dactylosporangium sp. NPDC049742 TaxID=3154737 RepID=UPI0034364724
MPDAFRPYTPQYGPNPAADPSWRIRQSWWLLLPILGHSCAGGAGFFYIGLRARRPAWWLPGIAYSVLGWADFLFILVSSQEQPSAAAYWALGALLVLWFVCVVHACLINSAWLQWRAGYVPWYAEPSAPPPTWRQPAPTAGFTSSSAYSDPVPPAFSQAPPAVALRKGAPAVVDVNTVSAADLARLPGFDLDRVRRTVAERGRRAGFASVEEFASAAGLAPHEFAPLRDRLTCTPPRMPWQRPPEGRVLDV